MNYQLVAIFEKSNHYALKDVQRTVCKKMNLYKPVPVLNIPICTLVDADAEITEQFVCKVLAPYKHFKVNIKNSMSLAKDNKVYIEIDKCGYISSIQRNITEFLNLKGMKLGTKSQHLVIPIANGNYNFKKLLQKNKTLSVFKNRPFGETIEYGKIIKFELWKLSGPRKDNVVVTFPLRPF